MSEIISVTEQQIPRLVAVGTSIVELLGEKTTSARSVLYITNSSTLNQVITLGVGQDAVASYGIVLYPGASYIESPSEGFRPTNARITAVASAAAGQVSVYERAV